MLDNCLNTFFYTVSSGQGYLTRLYIIFNTLNTNYTSFPFLKVWFWVQQWLNLELDLCEPEPMVQFKVQARGRTKPQVQFMVLQKTGRTELDWTFPTLGRPLKFSHLHVVYAGSNHVQ